MSEICEIKKQWLLNVSFCCGVIVCFYCFHRKGSTDAHIDCVEHLLEVCSVKCSNDGHFYKENPNNFLSFFLRPFYVSLYYLSYLVWSVEFQAVLYAISLKSFRHIFKILAFSKMIMFWGFECCWGVVLQLLRFYFCFCLNSKCA